MATPAVGAACLLLARAAGSGPGPRRGDGGGQARPRRLQRAVHRRCVAELSREGPAPAPRPMQPQLAPPLVPGFLAPPRDPESEPASPPPTVPDDGLGDLDLDLEGKSGSCSFESCWFAICIRRPVVFSARNGLGALGRFFYLK
jgi:starch synthase